MDRLQAETAELVARAAEMKADAPAIFDRVRAMAAAGGRRAGAGAGGRRHGRGPQAPAPPHRGVVLLSGAHPGPVGPDDAESPVASHRAGAAHGPDRPDQRLGDAAGRGPGEPPPRGRVRVAAAARPSFRIDDLSLSIFDGETLVILGPSGCGKTTLLKIIAGLIPPDSGEVRYDGVDVDDVPPGDRRIGMVFQNYALYPHMTSRTNVLSYFLFRKKTPEMDAMAREKYRRTSELMGVELEYLLDRRPTTLSGGEKQRVALGRCITRDPGVFLLDEPFSNLDQALREKYRVNLKTLLRQFNISTVYVTHDHVRR